MRRFDVVWFLLLTVGPIALPVQAEEGSFWIAAKIGYGLPKPQTETSLPVTGKDSSGGFVGALSGQGFLSETVAMEAELGYSRRRASMTYAGGRTSGGTPLPDITADYTFDSVEASIRFKWESGKGRFRPFGSLGAVFSVPLKIESVNTSPGSIPLTEDAQSQFARTSWAAEIGLGCDARMKDSLSLLLEARFLYPLSNSAATGGDVWKWRDYRLLAGARVRM